MPDPIVVCEDTVYAPVPFNPLGNGRKLPFTLVVLFPAECLDEQETIGRVARLAEAIVVEDAGSADFVNCNSVLKLGDSKC